MVRFTDFPWTKPLPLQAKSTDLARLRYPLQSSALYSNPTPSLTLTAMSMHSRFTASFDRTGKSEKLPLAHQLERFGNQSRRYMGKKAFTEEGADAHKSHGLWDTKKWTALIGFCKRDTIT